VGADTERGNKYPEPFAEVVDTDEGVPAAHGYLHSSYENINITLIFYEEEDPNEKIIKAKL
jgi:hypothetical protein